uniref:Uncharacterized protein n=1 Tax=Moniliophthora roreri TaxID=221103 RepID=A0A0W0FN71_MONRR
MTYNEENDGQKALATVDGDAPD